MGLKLKDWERQVEKTTTMKPDAVRVKAETELFAKQENGIEKENEWGMESIVQMNGSPHMDGAGTGNYHLSLSLSFPLLIRTIFN